MTHDDVTKISGRNLEIEALRGVAVLMILYAHLASLWLGDDLYNSTRLYLQPGTGVDLFFCISGYVICRHLLPATVLHRSWHAFTQFAMPFWIRRFWRLAPTAWLWLSLMFLVSISTDDRSVFLSNLYDIVAALLQLENFHLYDCRVGLTQVVCGRQAYFWSLSLEEQFYLAFPFLIFFLPRHLLVIVMALIVALQISLTRTPLLWLIRTDALAFGILIALTERSLLHKRLSPAFLDGSWIRWIPFFVCVSLIVGLEAPKFQFVSFPTGLVAVASAVIIWLSSYERGYAVPAGAVRRGLMFFGSRSYALYIIHIPAVWFVTTFIEKLTNAPASALSIAIAVPAFLFAAVEINYRFLEMPLRQYGATIARRFRSDEIKRELQLT